MWCYRGINRRGVHTMGSTSVEPYEFVKAKFVERWRELDVYPATGEDVDSVGQINWSDRRRVWWADTDLKPSAA